MKNCDCIKNFIEAAAGKNKRPKRFIRNIEKSKDKNYLVMQCGMYFRNAKHENKAWLSYQEAFMERFGSLFHSLENYQEEKKVPQKKIPVIHRRKFLESFLLLIKKGVIGKISFRKLSGILTDITDLRRSPKTIANELTEIQEDLNNFKE